ncbi:GroES-like protein [Aaosphaeria arxii CBS 175.79]|uniref:GroES-like protein n=1 Tax=Aaosphaeria arxii CBS 175.79 TaxID=1450172 RepID=A0A6A5XV91_9PLEO|nr:GroES-like protein [Aaosphaeria arxii CBS 175.79]KAF2016869.1 GroES-like protein [Aaosphaeria arxii CBS 175.79]
MKSYQDATAVVQHQDSLVLSTVQLPSLQDHQVYVKVEFAAFNPTDRLAFDLQAFGDDAVLGCEFVGTVVEAHPTVTKLEVGDCIAALVWGGEIKGLGAYSTFCIADERLSFKIPDGIAHPSACSIPLAANTAYLALFSQNSLGLPQGGSGNGRSVLIWGGSSIVGYFAIQFANLHGFTVAATCSPRNFDLVKNAGATHVFDYANVDVVTRIQECLPELSHVFDTIGNDESSTTASKCLKSGTGDLCTVRPGRAKTEGVSAGIRVTDVFVFTAFPTPHTYRGTTHWPVIMENHALSAALYEDLPRLLLEEMIIPPPVKCLGNLSPEAVLEAMHLNRTGKVSAEKLYFEVFV